MNESEYRRTFRVVGHEVGTQDALPESRLVDAEERLGCEAPLTLRSFYALAGNARSIIGGINRFLLPEQWRLEGSKLVFLADYMNGDEYAIEVGDTNIDPPVFMWSEEDEHPSWKVVCVRCSEFIQVMIHWEGIRGRLLPYMASGITDERIRESLKSRYAFAGEVDQMWAFGKPGLALCLSNREGWRLFVGVKDEVLLEEIESLDVTIDHYE